MTNEQSEAIVRAFANMASALNRIGLGDNNGKGALEGLADAVEAGSNRIAESLDGIAASIDGLAEAVNQSNN